MRDTSFIIIPTHVRMEQE